MAYKSTTHPSFRNSPPTRPFSDSQTAELLFENVLQQRLYGHDTGSDLLRSTILGIIENRAISQKTLPEITARILTQADQGALLAIPVFTSTKSVTEFEEECFKFLLGCAHDRRLAHLVTALLVYRDEGVLSALTNDLNTYMTKLLYLEETVKRDTKMYATYQIIEAVKQAERSGQ